MKAFLSVAQATCIYQRHENDPSWDFWEMTVDQIWAELLVLEAQSND